MDVHTAKFTKYGRCDIGAERRIVIVYQVPGMYNMYLRQEWYRGIPAALAPPPAPREVGESPTCSAPAL